MQRHICIAGHEAGELEVMPKPGDGVWRAAQVKVNAPGGGLGLAESWPQASVRGQG